MSNRKGVYRFYWDCRRQGEVKGVFTATEEEVKSILGKEVYFGEILGKHSEVYGVIEEGEITLLTDNEEAVRVVEEFGLEIGYNPFHYLPEEEDDEEE